METVLRRLRLKRGESQESDARKRLQKELFEFTACSEHGFPQKPSALAYDPMLSLLAVGTENGDVRIYGRPGVYVSGKHEDCLSVTKMQFLPDQGRLVTFCTDNSLHLWEINIRANGTTVLEEVKSFAMENSKLKMITSHCLTADASQLLLGTDGGSIHVFDTETFTLTDKVIFHDLILQNAADDLKASPGTVEAVLQHPSAADKILVGYSRGLIVLWDMTANKPEYTYTSSEAVEALAFNDDGSEFICAHADGSYVVWTTTNSLRPKENPYTPYGPFPCKAITSVQWKSGKAGTAWMVFGGGMPRANFSDRHTVSVVHGSSHVTFDFSSRVIDFTLLCQPTSSDAEPQCVIVMTEMELVAVDLTTDGWPLHRVPYLLGLSALSPVTCVQHAAGVSDVVWNNIVAAGNAEVGHWSMKDWPVTGGEVIEKPGPAARNIVLTGHADGKVCFWDMNLRAATDLMYSLNTASIFVTDTDEQETASAPADEDWPPFRKVGSSSSSDEEKRVAIQKLVFCPSSGKLLVGGADGHVTLFTFESESGERHVETAVIDFTACQEGIVWNGPEALAVKSDLTWSEASYQPLCVAVTNPPTACTALTACHRQLVAVSTSYGFGVFDLVHSKMVYATSVSVPSGVKISRSRSFQRVRESFRQLRRHKSESDHKLDQKTEQKETETKPEATEKAEEKTEEKQEGVSEVVVETTEKVEKMTIEETKESETEVTVEKTESKEVEKIETKEVITTESTAETVEETEQEDTKDTTDEPEVIAVEEAPKPENTTDGTKSAEVQEGESVTTAQSKSKKSTKEAQTVMTNIESLYFADTYLFQGQPNHLSLWVGTSSGHVFIYQLTVPDGERRREEDVTCFLAKEIRLKHGAPVVATFIVDRNLHPLSESAVIKGGSDAESPAATGGHRLVVCTQQQIKIFSLPNFKAHHKYKLPTREQDAHFVAAEFATFVSKSDEVYSESDLVCMTNHGKLFVFSLPHLRRQLCTSAVVPPDATSGARVLSLVGGIYCHMMSEVVEFSVSACQAAAGCSVPLKEGMRPAPVVAEETEVAETGKDETPAEKAEETAADDSGKVSQEQPVSSVDEKVAGVNESVASGNDSLMASGDVTMDSIKEHTKEMAPGESGVVSSHKVVETTVHTVKTVGGSVSETKTTTVEELKTVEGIITSCMETTSAVSSTPAEKIEGN